MRPMKRAKPREKSRTAKRVALVRAATPRGRDYLDFVADLKTRIRSARLAAARAVNSEVILLYWDIGREITARQEKLGWGEAVIDRLSADLQRAFPAITGFSARNLRSMRQFFAAYSSADFWLQAVAKLGENSTDPIWRQAVAKLPDTRENPIWLQAAAKLDGTENEDAARRFADTLGGIPWGQHLLILNKVSEAPARLYYLRGVARLGWTRAVLLNQINARAYERSLSKGKTHNFSLALPEHLAAQAEEALKSSYNLEFLGIGRAVSERELEGRLTERLRDFILELGYGFCFVGRQHRIELGRKEYFIDLLFYHRFLKALVAIDLKLGEFEPEFAGKMDFYLNVLNSKDRAPGDAPAIGIILCAEKDSLEVEFALKSKTNPIGVAQYRLQPKLPAEFKGKLPTAKQLTDVIRSLLPPKATRPRKK